MTDKERSAGASSDGAAPQREDGPPAELLAQRSAESPAPQPEDPPPAELLAQRSTESPAPQHEEGPRAERLAMPPAEGAAPQREDEPPAEPQPKPPDNNPSLDREAVLRAEQDAANARAEQQRRAEQLRRFVEQAPAIVSARTLQELAEATAAMTQALFEADETFVSLRYGRTEITGRRGGAPTASPLMSWLVERHSLLPLSGNRISEHRLAITLTSRNGEFRGTIAAQFTNPIHPSESHLFDQLSLLVSTCSDNLLLYEEAAKAVRARDDILAAVSHDLRAPLNNVRLGASLLRETAPSEDMAVVERIERSVVHMTRLVNDLVDMVQIEGGKLDLTIQTEQVDELLSAVNLLITPRAEAQELRLTVHAPAAALTVRADRQRALQVLMNLLGNAVKFTPPGGEVTLRAVEEGDFVRFEVIDSGPGIPDVEGERVFARFWRSDPKKRRGLGLGLFIAKGLVVAQGGRLWFDSAPGRGSSFFFTLPRVAVSSS